jgi:hypothetical protein
MTGTASIYGGVHITAFSPPCVCDSTVDPLDTLQTFLDFLRTLYTALESFYIGDNVNAPLVAFMSVAGAMKFSLHSRLVWTKLNPGLKFNQDSIIDINAIKDIYLSAKRDWKSDQFLVMQTLLLATY